MFNPISDSRWDKLVARHPQASAFHQRGWIEALVRTYGYDPFVLTSTPPGQTLRDGIVLCRISSWITGTRVVSVPFADHCEPLLQNPADYGDILRWLRAECDHQHWKYVELRPLAGIPGREHNSQASRSYWFHELDITRPLETIFRELHKNSIQRRIQHAEREGLSYEVGRSDQIVSEFYRLLLVTRRRHYLPPQPRTWFKNLIELMGDKVQISLARKDITPVAAILTLRHGSSVIYKYGCSDEKLHHLGGMPFLFWKLIEESKAAGADKIDFGRSDLSQESLITFKDKLGASKKLLNYYRYPEDPVVQKSAWSGPAIRKLVSVLPGSVLSTAGRMLYRHMG